MINADEIDTLLFDVLGTVVDEAGSMRAELGAALERAGAGERTQALAAAWERRFTALVSAIGDGAPWRSVALRGAPPTTSTPKRSARRCATARGGR